MELQLHNDCCFTSLRQRQPKRGEPLGVRTSDTKPEAPVAHHRTTPSHQPLVGTIDGTADAALVTPTNAPIMPPPPAFADANGFAATETRRPAARLVKSNGQEARAHRGAARQNVAREAEGPVRRLNSALEAQSTRVAGALHDEVSQVLASAHMAIEEVSCEVSPAVQTRLLRVRQHLHEVAAQLRQISHELHPDIVDDLGVIEAIKFIGRAFTRETGIQLSMNVDVNDMPPALGRVVFRLVREALTNVGQHAQATATAVSISREGSRLLCVICDDGAGFDVAAVLARSTPRNLGLRLVRARIEALGGTLDISSAPRQGTRLRTVLPVEP
jgi:signal transduction histidine kinase